MRLNLNDHQLKIDYYKHRFVYTKYNQKFTTDIKEIKGKESKHNTTESHQHTREQENKKGTEKNYKNNQKTIT